MNGLDLFSGIGGLSLALKEYLRPIAYCEIDPYCQGVLLSRMVEGCIPCAPIWDDIRTFAIVNFPQTDIIYGGFPCQDISIAGNGKGLEGERSGLFFEILRLAEEIEPTFIFLENVPAITARGGIQVVGSLAKMGHDCRWCCIPAQEFVDQRRERWFLLAKSNRKRCLEGPSKTIQSQRQSSVDEKLGDHKLSNMEKWASFAKSVREDNGICSKVDRIKALGNAVVPQQAKKAFKILMGLT